MIFEELINVLEKTLIRLQSFPNHPMLNQFIEIFNYEEILMVLLHNADMSRNKRWRMKCKNLYEKYRSIIAEKHNDLSQIDEDPSGMFSGNRL